jgi:hypothetical protein
MNDAQRATKLAQTATMLEDLADTVHESMHGTDDTTRSMMHRSAMQFFSRANELRLRCDAYARVASGPLEEQEHLEI